MIKNIKKLAFILSLVPALTFAKANTDLVVGLYDMQEILIKVDESQSVRKKLEDFYKSKQEVIKADEEKFKKLQEGYEKQRTVMNDKAKADKEKELRELYVGLQEKTMQYQKEIQDLEKKLKGPILDRIVKVKDTVSENANLFMSFEKNEVPGIYAVNKKDITADIITAYNKEYPSKK